MNPRPPLSFIRLREGSLLLPPTKRDSARQPSRLCWSRAITGRGLGYATAQAIAGAGINMDFLLAQVVGRKYSAVFGFESDADATKCAAIIRKATAAKKR